MCLSHWYSNHVRQQNLPSKFVHDHYKPRTNFLLSTGPEEILLLARRQDLRTISLETEDHSIFLLPMTNVRQAVAVDFDPVEDHLYWTDDERKAIVRAHLDGSGDVIFVKLMTSSTSL